MRLIAFLTEPASIRALLAHLGEPTTPPSAPPRCCDAVDFTVSPYSLPYSDNTLLRSGNRFGVYIRRVEPRRIPCRPPTCDPQDSRQ